MEGGVNEKQTAVGGNVPTTSCVQQGKHKYTMVPAKYKEDPQLGRWVSNLRACYKNKKMTEERKQPHLKFHWLCMEDLSLLNLHWLVWENTTLRPNNDQYLNIEHVLFYFDNQLI